MPGRMASDDQVFGQEHRKMRAHASVKVPTVHVHIRVRTFGSLYKHGSQHLGAPYRDPRRGGMRLRRRWQASGPLFFNISMYF